MMKLKKVVVSVLLLTLLVSVFFSFGVTALAEDAAPQEAVALAHTYEAETTEEAAQDSVGFWIVAGCTVLLAVFGVLSVNCQKIYDSEK